MKSWIDTGCVEPNGATTSAFFADAGTCTGACTTVLTIAEFGPGPLTQLSACTR